MVYKQVELTGAQIRLYYLNMFPQLRIFAELVRVLLVLYTPLHNVYSNCHIWAVPDVLDELVDIYVDADNMAAFGGVHSRSGRQTGTQLVCLMPTR